MRAMFNLEEELGKLRKAQMLRQLTVLERSEGSGCIVELEGRKLVNFASNDYLGLSVHPEVIGASREALERHGLGAGASRLMSGTSVEHCKLESELAEFFGTENALVFSSGYLANIGVLYSVAEEEDVLLVDRRSHASLIDGGRLSRARFRVYGHNDVEELESSLERYAGARRRFIVTEGIFSMDGDRAHVRELIELAQRRDAWVILDDAHAIGVVGRTGAGSLEELGMKGHERVILVGTLSKSLGALGGFVAGTSALKEWMINRARSFIYTTGLPPMIAAGARKALELTREGEGLRKRLNENVRLLRERLAGLKLDTGEPASQIVPVILGSAERAVEVSRNMSARGMYVPAIRPPTVAEGTARLRVSVTAAHQRENIEKLAVVLAEIACK